MIPYGYYVRDGETLADGDKKEIVHQLFDLYLSGLSIEKAAKMVGIPRGIAGRILENPIYLGDEMYPAMIDEETFHLAQEERRRRNTHVPGQARLHRRELEVRTRFRMEIKAFPREVKAEWLYNQIKEAPEGRAAGYRMRLSPEEREQLMRRLKL